MAKPLRTFNVAVGQPLVDPDDFEATIEAHAAIVEEAIAELAVFPELSLTGYELEAAAVEVDDPRLRPLLTACEKAGTTALVGAPIVEDGIEHIATIAVDGAGARVVYRKVHLGGDEKKRFSPGPGAVAIEVSGFRIGLGICKDTGVAAHVRATSRLGLDFYAAGVVHLPEELEEQSRRARHIGSMTGVPVALASFAGPTGGGYDRTAGCSAIWAADGTLDISAGAAPGGFARTPVWMRPA